MDWSSNSVPLVIAAVRVVFPWSTWPTVPMFTWGLLLEKVSFFAGAAYFRNWNTKDENNNVKKNNQFSF